MSALFSELSNPVSNLLNPGLGGNGSSLEEKRALELALELTMLNFNDPMSGNGMDSLMGGNNHQHQSSGLGSPNMMNSLNAFSALMGNGLDDTRKKSQNMTECVPVPSSEHVAEIVGRQGRCLFALSTSFLHIIVKRVCVRGVCSVNEIIICLVEPMSYVSRSFLDNVKSTWFQQNYCIVQNL